MAKAARSPRPGRPGVESILQTVIDAIITIDQNGIMQWVNPAAEKIFGYSAAEMIGKNVSLLMPPPFSRRHDGYIRKYLRTGKARILGIGREVTARRKDGSVFPAYLGVSEGRREGRRRFFTGVIRDVTDRHDLERMLFEAGKQERRLIGQELHDGIAQHLASTAIVAKLIEKKTAKASPQASREIGRVVRLVNEAVAQTRKLAQGLYSLDRRLQDLVPSLEKLARSTEETVGIRCTVIAKDPPPLDAVSMMHLYRIAREAVGNAVKHGRGKNIWISLRRLGAERAELVVENDGRPFIKPAKETGLGLRLMRSRAAVLGASLTLKPCSRGGARVSCVFGVKP